MHFTADFSQQFHKMSKYIASASSVVKFHDFSTRKLIHNYQPTSNIEGPCRSLSWTKDGVWLAVVPYSGFTEIITLKNGCKPLHTIQNISEPSCASFQNLTKRNVAVGTKSGQVLLYDVKSKNVKARYPRTSSSILHVGFTAKDTHCYAACASGDIHLYSTVVKVLSASLRVPKSQSVTTVEAHVQKRNLLAAGSNEGIIAVWDINANKVKFQNEAHDAPVSSIVISPLNSSLIVSSGLDRNVRVFDTENKTRLSTISVDNNIVSLDFLEDSLYIAMGSQNGKILIFDTRSLNEPVAKIEAHNSAVKHLRYQNHLTDSNSLSIIISEESDSRKSSSNVENHSRDADDGKESQSNRNNVSLSLPLGGIDGHSENNTTDTMNQDYSRNKQQSINNQKEKDSFLDALGIEENTPDSLHLNAHHLSGNNYQSHMESGDPIIPSTVINTKENSVLDQLNLKQQHHAEDDCKRLLTVNLPTPNLPKILQGKLGNHQKTPSQKASTPKIGLGHQFFNEGVSPIVSSGSSEIVNQPTGINRIELASLMKNTFQDTLKDFQGEMKKSMEEVENKLYYQSFNLAHEIRRMILNFHLTTCKQFIKIEDDLNILRDDNNGCSSNNEPVSIRESQLMEENMNLRRKIRELEIQITKMQCRCNRSEDNNGNCE